LAAGAGANGVAGYRAGAGAAISDGGLGNLDCDSEGVAA
jgi:hypothetical protein